MKLRWMMLLSVALLAFSAPTLAQDETEQVVINATAVMPEGVEYDAAGERFLFGSLSQGTIRQVTDDGMVSTFVEDPDLKSTVGLQIDAANHRLLVANSDTAAFAGPEAVGKAWLMAYDLDSAERLFAVDLGAVATTGRNFANDVTVDEDGNAYVTNSFSPIIYKVDMDGNASVFAQDDDFSNASLGLNGIDYSPDGYLLASVGGSAQIFKIPLDDPSNVTEVVLDEPFGADGMAFGPDGVLFAVGNYADSQAIVALISDDEWATAQTAAMIPTTRQATTLAIRDGEPWYINAYLDNPQQAQYEIVHANLAAG